MFTIYIFNLVERESEWEIERETKRKKNCVIMNEGHFTLILVQALMVIWSGLQTIHRWEKMCTWKRFPVKTKREFIKNLKVFQFVGEFHVWLAMCAYKTTSKRWGITLYIIFSCRLSVVSLSLISMYLSLHNVTPKTRVHTR